MKTFYTAGLVGVITLLVFIGCTPEDPNTYDQQAALQPIVSELILPLHSAFEANSVELQGRISVFTQQPDSISLINLRDTWLATQSVWKQCELFNFGEIQDRYLHLRIGNWPSSPDMINLILGGTDSISAGLFTVKGSNTQGLAAMEYLLFAENIVQTVDAFRNGNLGERRKDYLKAIGENLVGHAQLLNNVWQPGGENFGYKWANSDEAGLRNPMGQFVNALIALTQDMAQLKIGTALGKYNMGIPQPTQVEGYYCGASLDFLAQNLSIITQSFGGKEGKQMLAGAIQALGAKYHAYPLDDAIHAQISRVRNVQANITLPLSEAVVQQYAEVEEYYQELRALLTLLKVDLASSLSVTVTVSDNDGD